MTEYEPTPAGAMAGRVDEMWYAHSSSDDVVRSYRPSVMIECSLGFRSLKAGISQTEDRRYTAWLPDGDLPVDWDTPAVAPLDPARLSETPLQHDVPNPRHTLSMDRLADIERELLELLTRREKLVVLYNPLFEIFSGIGEPKEDFLARAGEAALAGVEAELKQLKQTFELRLEQIREAQARSARPEMENAGQDAGDSKGEIERLLIRRTEFYEAENKLASLFTGLAGLVLNIPLMGPRDRHGSLPGTTAELHEDLKRLEREASVALNELYTRYLEMVRSYDEFAIGIQMNSIRVVRRALLWVPV